MQFALQRNLTRIDLDLLGEAFEAGTNDPVDDFLLDFDADPIVEELNKNRQDNPYLADEQSFRKLWAAMADGRLQDSSRETRHKKTGTPAQKIF